MAKYVKPTPEELALEEEMAKAYNMSVLRYRQFMKFREKGKQVKLEKKLAIKKEKQKLKNIEKGKEKRRKTFEKKRKKKEKELLKLKEKLKKQKEREKAKAKAELQKKKRKVGRPKKCGRKINWYKRKKKQLALEKKRSLPRKYVSWPYKIVACKNGIQFKYIDKFTTLEKAYEKINELLSEEIIIPQIHQHKKNLKDVKFEYLLLTHKTDEIPMLRNEYGKVVEQITTSEKWEIYDKFTFQIEETFWVWGYNNKTERKTFKWIYDNILVGSINSPYDIRRIILYKNKIVFLHDDDFIDLIICKTMEDSIRFYNKLEEFVKKDKIKQIFFLGSYSHRSDKRKILEEQLIKLTGWTKKKLQLSTSIPHYKNLKNTSG